MKNNISKFNKCTNCGACYNACPVDAISVDASSFFYKCVVDEKKCINCGKCVVVCPLNTPKQKQKLYSAIAGWSKDDELVKKSSSGGAFSVLANYFLENGGVVYGAVYSDDKKTIIFRGTDEVPLDEIRRSKYVESSVGFIFRKIKKELEDGKLVLFCGAPCQVAGLKRYLIKEYENLTTCDFVCGGMPSHKLYEHYINELEKKYNSKVTHVNFRSAEYGWSVHSMLCFFENKKKYTKYAAIDPYFDAFVHKRMSIREDCYDCQFTNNHHADLILSDFWVWQAHSKLQNDECGISLIVSNSLKGETFLDLFRKDMEYEEIGINYAGPYVTEEKITNIDIKKREKFLNDSINKGIWLAAKEIGTYTGFKAFLYTIFKTTKNKIALIKRRKLNSKKENK